MAGIFGLRWCNMRLTGICVTGFLLVASVLLVSAQEFTEQKASNQDIEPNFVARVVVSKNSSSHLATRSGYKHVWPVSFTYFPLFLP